MKKKGIILFAALALLPAGAIESSADTRTISRLDVQDAWQFNYNASHWIERGGMSVGDSMYGEESIAITSLPSCLDGADWIQPAFRSKSFDRDGDICSFSVKCPSVVYIIHNDAIDSKPEWMNAYLPTKEKLANEKGENFTLYFRRFKTGEEVHLGKNGSSIHNMYVVAVKPLSDEVLPPKSQPCGYVVNIAERGAVADGRTVNTEVIQKSIDECSRKKKGGTVYLDGGVFVSGTIVLKDGVSLWVSEGTILRASAEHSDFPPIRCSLPSYRGKEDFQFIYAEKAENIAITGGGIIDGYSLFEGYPWKGRNNEHERPRLIRMVECSNVDVTDITLIRSANWTQYYEACRDMRFYHVTVRCYTGTNNQDGIDLSGCSNVTVNDFMGICGDDVICLKALSMVPASNIRVTGVRSRYANCNIVKIGTETHGDISNVYIGDIEGWTRYSLAIESVDGSNIDGVTYENARLYNCASPFVVRLGSRGRTFEGGPQPATIGSIRNVTLRGIRNTGIGFVEKKGGPGVGAAIGGLPGNPIENILIEDCDLLMYGSIDDPEYIYHDVPENEKKYPEFDCYGTCPAYGIYLRHVRNATVRNVNIRLLNNDVRPAIVHEDSENMTFENISADTCSRTEPSIIFHKK